MQQIQATIGAFAAILEDGSVVTWGRVGMGGDSSAVWLKNVEQIQATWYAFAAILGDGSVVSWGNAGMGGDSSAVRGQLQNVQQIQATNGAFAAILGDGSVVTWGDASFGGESSAVRDQLNSSHDHEAKQFDACWCTSSLYVNARRFYRHKHFLPKHCIGSSRSDCAVAVGVVVVVAAAVVFVVVVGVVVGVVVVVVAMVVVVVDVALAAVAQNRSTCDTGRRELLTTLLFSSAVTVCHQKAAGDACRVAEVEAYRQTCFQRSLKALVSGSALVEEWES